VRECELVAHVVMADRIRRFQYDPAVKEFVSDDGAFHLSDSALRALAARPGREVTYTCLPPGTGALAVRAKRTPREAVGR
jgi:hypothetical protein